MSTTRALVPPATFLLAALALPSAVRAQTVRAEVYPPAPQFALHFGNSLDSIPGWLFVGALDDDTGASSAGAVHVHQETAGGWDLVQTLYDPTPEVLGWFGQSVAAQDEWLVVGQPNADGTSDFNEGAAYVYRLQGGAWIFHQQLQAHDAALAETHHFGVAVDLDGGVLAIGSRADGVGGEFVGAAYVFELQGSTWVETQKLKPASASDWEVGGSFGHDVAVSGTTLAIAANGLDNGSPGSNQGAVFLFVRNGASWVQLQKLVAGDSADGDWFGQRVALEGESLLVTSRFHDHDDAFAQEGALYAFERQAVIWIQTQELQPHDPWHPMFFGESLDVEGEIALVGATQDDDQAPDAGSAYAWRRAGGQWEPFAKILAPDGLWSDGLGADVAVHGTRALVSAPGDDDLCGNQCANGSVYDFELAPRATQYGHCLFTAVCNNFDSHGGCVNSAGQGAVLAAGGATGVAADALRLEAHWLPANVPGLLFYGGASQPALPFADGNLLVASGGKGVFRILPAQSSGAQGALIWDGGLVAASQSNPPLGRIQAGDTWFFQAWYRDPAGPCAKQSNTSNGLSVEFEP